MTLEKICGIETEWSILLPDRPQGQREASVKEFKLFLKVLREFFNITYTYEKTEWEFSTKQAWQDFLKVAESSKMERSIFAPNGARIYVDYPHFEYSTPECKSIKDLICADKAGSLLMHVAGQKISEILGERVSVYKTNSDRRGHSWASHENYLIKRQTFDKLTKIWKKDNIRIRNKIIAFLITRQIFAGSGKQGIEKGRFWKRKKYIYQLSQRSDFITQVIGHDTVANRNIINTRDEPHADPEKYARLHVILGDANLCDWSLYLRIGTMQLVLKMLEHGFINNAPIVYNPIKEIKNVSRDITYTHELKLENGSCMRAIDIQYFYARLAQKYIQTYKASEEEKDVVNKWLWILDKLSADPKALIGYLDNISKYYVIDFKKKRSDLADSHPDLKSIDIAYHNIDPYNSSYALLDKKGIIQHLVSDEEIKAFMKHPPKDTRAYLRGKIAARWPDAVIDWEKIDYIFKNELYVDNKQNNGLTAIGHYDILLKEPLMETSDMDALFQKLLAFINARTRKEE